MQHLAAVLDAVQDARRRRAVRRRTMITRRPERCSQNAPPAFSQAARATSSARVTDPNNCLQRVPPFSTGSTCGTQQRPAPHG
jgi:hypothetical protein